MAGDIASRVQVVFELQGLAMALAGNGRSEAALEVDAMALALSDELGLPEEAEWWERLRARHLGLASASLMLTEAAAARSLGSERPPAERLERALALAQGSER